MEMRCTPETRLDEASGAAQHGVALQLLKCCGMISGAGLNAWANAELARGVSPASEPNGIENLVELRIAAINRRGRRIDSSIGLHKQEDRKAYVRGAVLNGCCAKPPCSGNGSGRSSESLEGRLAAVKDLNLFKTLYV